MQQLDWRASQVYQLDWHASQTYQLDWHASQTYKLDWHASQVYQLDWHASQVYQLDWRASQTYRLDWHASHTSASVECRASSTMPHAASYDAQCTASAVHAATSATSRAHRVATTAECRFFNISEHADGGTPTTRVDLKVPKDASHRDLSGATLRLDLALGVRRRHAPKSR